MSDTPFSIALGSANQDIHKTIKNNGIKGFPLIGWCFLKAVSIWAVLGLDTAGSCGVGVVVESVGWVVDICSGSIRAGWRVSSCF